MVLSLFISAVYYYLFYHSNSQREIDFLKCEKYELQENLATSHRVKTEFQSQTAKNDVCRKIYNGLNIMNLD